MGGIIDEQKGTLLRAGGLADHAHLLAKLSPTIAISDGLRLVKANSSKWVNEHHPSNRKFQWQSGYAAFSVSESQAATVKRYIDNQQKHHQTRSFDDEFLAMLKRHNTSSTTRSSSSSKRLSSDQFASQHSTHKEATHSRKADALVMIGIHGLVPVGV